MLDGINVLNTIAMHKEFPTWASITIGLLFGVGIGLICCFKFKTIVVGIISCIIGFLILAYGVNTNLQYSGEYTYQVTIDESVSMVDFTSKYDIIRVDGEIYTIREKE